MTNQRNQPAVPSRRAFLRTAGTVVWLPFLPSLLPRAARAAAVTKPPVRLLTYFCPNGMIMDHWTPTTSGATYTLSPILQPLAAIRDAVTVVTGLNNDVANQNHADGAHNRGTACFAVCKTIPGTGANGPLLNDISADQMAVAKLGAGSPVASLQLGVMTNPNNICDKAYNCAYTHSTSWASATQMLEPLTSPAGIFQQYFRSADAGQSTLEQTRRAALRRSVLDDVLDQANGLSAQLGHGDKARLDEYFTAVRAVETQLVTPTSTTCGNATQPVDSSDFATTYAQMNALMTLAFQCDLTRVISFMFGSGFCPHFYKTLPGVNDEHHSLSHHGGDPAKIAQLITINTFEMTMFAQLLTSLRGVQEADGSTVLDNTVVMLSSELSDGNQHTHTPLPVLLAGKGGGMLTGGGQHLRFDGADYASLWLTLLRGLGLPIKSFGMSQTATLSGLVAGI